MTLFFTEEFLYARQRDVAAAGGNATAAPAGDASAPDAPIYEATFFNPAAVRHIRNSHLYSSDITTKLLADSRREVPEFPRDAEAVKTFWRPVPEKGKGSVKVGVWQWRGIPPGADSGFPESDWPHSPVCVELDPDPGSGCLSARDRFITMTTTSNNSSGFSCPGSATCPQLAAGRTLILLAMHVATKQKPDWVWATFWWKGIERTEGSSPDSASWTCDNAQRPAELATGLWSNYSMNVTTSFIDRKPKVADADMNTCGSPPLVGQYEQLLATYNPFIEAVPPLGRKSSCIDCHARAFNASQFPFYVPPVCSGAQYQAKLSDFQGRIRTDYMWSVALKLKASPTQ